MTALVVLLASLPLVLFLLSLHRWKPPSPRTADRTLSGILVLAASWAFLPEVWAMGPARDVDSFDYLSMAESFGPPLDDCIEGMDDRGYDRRAYLHTLNDRGWGYPALIGTLARLVPGEAAADCQPLFRTLRWVNLIALFSTCFAAAWLIYRHWTPSYAAYSRSALVFAVLLLDGYNFINVNRILTETLSLSLFTGCLVSGIVFWVSGGPRPIVVGTTLGFLALLLRSEHAVVEPLILPAFIVAAWRRYDLRRSALTWGACAVLGGLIVAGVSYAKYGTPQPTRATGRHLLNMIHRLPRDGGIYFRELPPGVRFTAEQRDFYERYVIPAAKTPGGQFGPAIALPAFVDMEPRELADYTARYGISVLWNNTDLWWDAIRRRFKDRAQSPNEAWQATVSQTVQGFLKHFDKGMPWWSWPSLMCLWLLGRWLWGRRNGLGMGAAPGITLVIMTSYYWHQLVAVATGEGEPRQSLFVTPFLPVLGLLACLDGIEVLVRQATRRLRSQAVQP